MSAARVPHNREAERAVLGSILITPEVIHDVAPTLGEGGAFFDRIHQQIWTAMLELDAIGQPCGDMLLIAARVDLDPIGGVTELGTMAEEVGHAGHAQHYAGIVRSEAVKRSLIAAGSSVVAFAREHAQVDTAPLVEACEKAIYEVTDDNANADTCAIGQIAREAMADVRAVMDGGRQSRRVVTTGYRGIDAMTHGLHGGELAILAARPSMGKTSLGSGIALAAAEAGNRVAFFSIEVGKDQLVRNWLCQRAEVNSASMRGGMCSEADYLRLLEISKELDALAIAVNDTPAMSMVGLRTAARRLNNRQGLDLIVIDYLQLLTASAGARRESRQQEVSEISQGLKALARDIDVPILALAQLNRQVDNREDHRPRMSDLRESGSIEQEADLIMFLYREGYYTRDDPAFATHAEVIVGKQRHGPTGSVQLHFEPKCARFTDRSSFGGGKREW